MNVEKFLDDVIEKDECPLITEEDVAVFRNRGEKLHISSIRLESEEEMSEDEKTEEVVEEALLGLETDLTSLQTIFIYMKGNVSFYYARKFAGQIRNRLQNEVEITFGTVTKHDISGVEITMLAV